jgi:membrane protein
MASWTDRVPGWLRKALRPAYPFYRAAQLWTDANGMSMSASTSFYGILSLAPLLILLVGVLGWWMDRSVLEQELVAQISTIVGQRGGALISQALDSARKPAEGVVASVVGFAVLLSGATGVFGELQAGFQRIWVNGSETPPKQNWWHGASIRLRGVAYVLAFGFLLLVSLVISTALNLLTGWAGSGLAFEQLVRVLSELAAFLVCAALFFSLMRMSSGPKPHWRGLAFGAAVGATLFTAGRQVLAAYLSSAGVVSAYGAAGSVVVLLMWIFFSSAILLYSAGCAKAVEELRREHNAPLQAPGKGRRPRSGLQVR